MSLYDWLLFLHVTGAFFLIGGLVVAGILNLLALGRNRRPSEVAALFMLIRASLPLIGIGLLLTLAIGLWLVHESPWNYGYGDTWVVVALILWVIATAVGNIHGRYQRETGELAQRLAGEGDAATPELRARLRSPWALTLSYGSGLLAFAILGLMIWKPGA